MIDENRNIILVKNVIYELIAKSNKETFVIIDGDKTLIPVDSTKYFFEHLSIDFNSIKTIFQNYGYSFEAFYNVALFYSQIEREKYNEACIFSAKSVSLYPDFLTFIYSIKDIAEIIVVTSGIKQNWQKILDNHCLDFVYLIGGSYFPQDKFVVDKKAKGVIVDCLIKSHKKVFTFGDTLIDFDMLKKAHHAYLVVNEKMNKDIIPYVHEIPHLQQISFSQNYHSILPLTSLNTISNLIINYDARSNTKN